MNADFELELAALPGAYRPKPTIERRNARLEPVLVWLASRGDAIVTREAWPEDRRARAAAAGVQLLPLDAIAGNGAGCRFVPWGWTPRTLALAESAGASVDAPQINVVRRVNSKFFSHAIEMELGIAVRGATTARSIEELDDAVSRSCPGANDKWVVKGALGFNARERVLGRGPRLDSASATWVKRRFARGDELLFEPWLDVVREYGVQMEIGRDCSVKIHGISHMRTNGAGVTTGFVLGESVGAAQREQLERVAREVAARLVAAGYFGPANVDAIEHARGLRPLVEINARLTMGAVALAVERHLKPSSPVIWSP